MKSFHSNQETEVTGELVRSMDSVIDDTTSPGWVRQFNVHDDPPINAPGRLGKSRKRIDIKVVSSHRLPRSRFSFEAKRLGGENPVRDYLGPKGLGCFLAGDYGADEIDAGMLGYVQSDSLDDWAGKIGDKIVRSGKELKLSAGSSWKKHCFRSGPSHTYHTRHSRKGNEQDIDIYHTLLMCCPSSL